MPNVLILTFNAPSVADTEVSFYVNQFGINFEKAEIFKPLRSAPGQATIGTDGEDQAQKFYDAFIVDYGTANNFQTTIEDNVVRISNTLGLDIFGVSVPENITFDLVDTGITVTGIEGNRYLINNPIWISIGSGTFMEHFKVNLKNLYNGKTSTDIIIYPNQTGQAKLNLSPYIKGLFEYPGDYPGYENTVSEPIRNANVFEITVSAPNDPDTPTVTITKCFIRGGRRTVNINQSLPNSTYLIPQYKIPVWPGYPTAGYAIFGTEAVKIPLSLISNNRKDFRRVKGCNEVYVKFLNQLGGYSTWLFESHEDSQANTNLGGFIRNLKPDDLGNEEKFTKKLYSKVPEDYIDSIKDLIVSPEVYQYVNGVFERVRVGRNTIVSDSKKNGYMVSINIEQPNQFDPSLLWQN